MESKKTALFEVHQKLNAKMVAFAGYMMPIQYEGILAEHKRVRSTVGLFDVSHMGEFMVKGPNSLDFLQNLTVNDVSKLNVGEVQYSAMCYENGGIVDDLLIYRLPDHYMVVVNASNLQKDFDWMEQHLMDGVTLTNDSEKYCLLALQGPDSLKVLSALTDDKIDQMAFYTIIEGSVAGVPAFISRTGYTGEFGFEIGIAPDNAVAVWQGLMEAGKPYDIAPIGLGARDTLRLEMKYCLYGNDIDATTHPLEAGLGWITKLKKGDFIGREKIVAAKKAGLKRKLVCLKFADRAFPRHGYKIFAGDEEIGAVTSGTVSPMLNQGIAMAYVAKKWAGVDSVVNVEIRKKRMSATVVKPPFYVKPE